LLSAELLTSALSWRNVGVATFVNPRDASNKGQRG